MSGKASDNTFTGPSASGPVAEGSMPAGRPGAVAIAAVGSLLGVWFVVAWWVLGSPLVDAIGEAAGGALAVLVVVSFVGALRASRRL
jgi:hypothetical protein